MVGGAAIKLKVKVSGPVESAAKEGESRKGRKSKSRKSSKKSSSTHASSSSSAATKGGGKSRKGGPPPPKVKIVLKPAAGSFTAEETQFKSKFELVREAIEEARRRARGRAGGGSRDEKIARAKAALGLAAAAGGDEGTSAAVADEDGHKEQPGAGKRQFRLPGGAVAPAPVSQLRRSDDNATVFVGGLSDSLGDGEEDGIEGLLTREFERFGTVLRVRRQPGQRFGFVELDTARAASVAVATMDGVTLKGTKIIVRAAKDRDSRGQLKTAPAAPGAGPSEDSGAETAGRAGLGSSASSSSSSSAPGDAPGAARADGKMDAGESGSGTAGGSSWLAGFVRSSHRTLRGERPDEGGGGDDDDDDDDNDSASEGARERRGLGAGGGGGSSGEDDDDDDPWDAGFAPAAKRARIGLGFAKARASHAGGGKKVAPGTAEKSSDGAGRPETGAAGVGSCGAVNPASDGPDGEGPRPGPQENGGGGGGGDGDGDDDGGDGGSDGGGDGGGDGATPADKKSGGFVDVWAKAEEDPNKITHPSKDDGSRKLVTYDDGF